MPATEPATSILPDHADAQNASAAAPDRADDLIAGLADQQIDAMLGQAGLESPLAAAEREEVIDAGVAAEESQSEAAVDLAKKASGDLVAELDQLEAAREAKPAVTISPEPAAPTFNPPRHAAISPDLVEKVSAESPAPVVTEPVLPVEESSAEAVARELAADVALLSTPLPAVVEHDAEELKREPRWRRAIAAIVELPMLILGAINLPVRPLGDRGREIIGAIGILTLVNAAGLIVYAMFFARH